MTRREKELAGLSSGERCLRVPAPLFLSCFCALLLGSACATFHMPTPDNFAEVQSSRWSLWALTSEEDKLVVTYFRSDVKQDLRFWANAVRNNLVGERGYTLVEEGAFKTDAGIPGHRFLFELSMGEVPYRYLLVLFATQGWWAQHIYTAQFLCEKINYAKSAPAVEDALEKFQPRRGKPQVAQ